MMKIKNLLASVIFASLILMIGCKKDDKDPGGNPVVIPVQTTISAKVPLAGLSTLAVLAGSGITNTGATNVTGDIGLCPGTSIGGFPPGILVGTQHINDAIATQAKLDLTTAYNNAASRVSTDIVTLSGNRRTYTYSRSL